MPVSALSTSPDCLGKSCADLDGQALLPPGEQPPTQASTAGTTQVGTCSPMEQSALFTSAAAAWQEGMVPSWAGHPSQCFFLLN